MGRRLREQADCQSNVVHCVLEGDGSRGCSVGPRFERVNARRLLNGSAPVSNSPAYPLGAAAAALTWGSAIWRGAWKEYDGFIIVDESLRSESGSNSSTGESDDCESSRIKSAWSYSIHLVN